MREYILNINFETWQNQLWFMNEDNKETLENWKKLINKIDTIKKSYSNFLEFQTGVIDYLKQYGFIRVQK